MFHAGIYPRKFFFFEKTTKHIFLDHNYYPELKNLEIQGWGVNFLALIIKISCNLQ
jgi:hypothetical protein